MSTRCTLIKLKSGSIPKVREWAKFVNDRYDEVLQTLVQEGVTVESVFLHQGEDADYLIYYMRSDDFEKSTAAFHTSELAIDAYHKQFKADAWETKTKLELLLDATR